MLLVQCFSLVYSYMLGLGLARCDLGLSHGLAGHATALDAYLFCLHHSTRRCIFIPPLCHKGGENVAARDLNYSATVQTSASSMVVTYLSVLQVCRLFYAFTYLVFSSSY